MNSRKNKISYWKPESHASLIGFSLTELLIAIGIIGILSSIAIPSFFRQIQATCQAEAANNLSLIASSASAYKDIYGTAPNSWKDLTDISAVMASKDPDVECDSQEIGGGPADSRYGLLTKEICIPNCDYAISRSSEKSGEEFIFNAVPTPNTGKKAAFNVVSCFDLSNGASDLKRGSKDVKGAAKSTDLVCWK